MCVSRCPPTAPAPGQNCYTLPDASDPCCNITVCDKPFLDPSQNVRKKEEEAENEVGEPLIDIGRIIEEGIDTTTLGSLEEVTTVDNQDEKLSRIINNPEFSHGIPGRPENNFSHLF